MCIYHISLTTKASTGHFYGPEESIQIYFNVLVVIMLLILTSRNSNYEHVLSSVKKALFDQAMFLLTPLKNYISLSDQDLLSQSVDTFTMGFSSGCWLNSISQKTLLKEISLSTFL